MKLFWLDEAEPEFSVYDYDNYRYHAEAGTGSGQYLPTYVPSNLFDGMKADMNRSYQPATLRTGPAVQKFGALVWSGDIHSSFRSLRNQFAAGLNIWESRGYRGGRRISAVFMAVIFTTRNSMNC